MKIVHLQGSMTPAGNAAYRLSTAMRAVGLDSYVLNLSRSVSKEHAYSYNENRLCFFSRAIDKVIRAYRKRNYESGSYFYTSLPVIGRDISKHPLVIDADVVYIHWVAGYLSCKNMISLAKMGKPIFVFMHDMWPITGGCHHSLGCKEYSTGCKQCKMFSFNNCSVSKQLAYKSEIYRKYPNIHFISPSKWLAGCAYNSLAMKNSQIHTIPNIVDEKIFKPLAKTYVREILNLPKDKKIIAFGCQAGQRNPFKGWDYLEKAINMINRDDIYIVIYGSDFNQETIDKVKYPIRFMGRINDETILALICNAANIFVSPSLCENFSLTILENILCRTSVIGFDTTGVPELVITGDTGYLARFKDVDDLAKGIEYLLDKSPSFDYIKSYSSKEIVHQHINIINKALNNGF